MAWIPRFCVVSDFTRIVPNQKIKYMVEEENITKDNRTYKNMVITEGIKDIKIMPFDGVCIHTPEMSKKLQEQIRTNDLLTSIIFRMPYAKGASHEIDFKPYCREHGIEYITDIWGTKHKIEELDMILTESAFKGVKFFKKYGDSRDFDDYLMQCEKYEHTFVVTKWAEQPDTEKIYTRANYQILQDLELDFEEFKHLADYSKEWGENLANGLDEYVWNFTGLTYKINRSTGEIIPPQTEDNYFKALLKNPYVLNDMQIRRHIIGLADKYFNEMCCGKLWTKGAFKFLAPDFIAFLEHITGQEVVGCLKEGEMWTQSLTDGVSEGECILERNPHIAKSEHAIVYAIGEREKELQKYAGHLYNVIQLNSYDITLNRLSGADLDGDLAFEMKKKDNPYLAKGINRNLPVVINIDEKATAAIEPIEDKALIKDFLFGSDNRIGEYSNCATKWNNKVISKSAMKKGVLLTEEERKKLKLKFDDYVNLIAIVNAKEIDSAKTHIKVNLPWHIQKNSGYYPYFMKYAGTYYAKQRKFNMAPSNMNLLCFELEKWKRKIKWKKINEKLFDYTIYLDLNIPHDDKVFEKIVELYRWWGKERNRISNKRKSDLQSFIKHWSKKLQKENRLINDEKKKSKVPLHLFDIDNDYEHDYKVINKLLIDKAKEIEPNDKCRANYAVKLCYGLYPNKSKNFAWLIAGDGIIKNMGQHKHFLPIPVGDSVGQYSYLGNYFSWMEYPMEDDF
ncbi:MAG: hypothetical protein AB9836_04625 [Aminipila sp.]